jgi:alpha-galactosidase
MPSTGAGPEKGESMPSRSSYTSHVKVHSRFSAEGFAPDGNLAKPVWKRAEWVSFSHHMSGRPTYPGAETQVASFWSAGDVYFAFRCKYTTLNTYQGEDPAKERWELWERDVVEVFANPQPERVNHYYEFEVAPNNQWIDLEIDKDKDPFNDAGWDSHFDHATRVDEKNKIWTCEMRIPLQAMSVSAIQPGDEWRINFYRADGPSDDSRRRYMCWSTIPEGKSFHAPTRFGIIRFVK